MTIEFSKQLTATETPIPGVVLFELPVHGDNRGVVQRELAAREDAGAWPPRFQARPEQRLLQ